VRHRISARATAACAAALLALAARGAGAQAPPPGAPAAAGPAAGTAAAMMPAGDADFVRAIAAANATELEDAKYVVNRTADPAVRAYAQRMIDDHSTAAVQLQARTRGTALLPAPGSALPPAAMGPGGAGMLRNDRGAALDRDYMRMQVPAHRMALRLVEWEAAHGQAPGLRAYAEALAPVIRQHLQIAEAYLSEHRLVPYAAPSPGPVPGNVAPNGNPGPGPGTVNNPAAPGANGGSTRGQNNGAPSPSASPRP